MSVFKLLKLYNIFLIEYTIRVDETQLFRTLVTQGLIESGFLGGDGIFHLCGPKLSTSIGSDRTSAA